MKPGLRRKNVEPGHPDTAAGQAFDQVILFRHSVLQ
jgi:hypothetical protein